MNTNNKTLENFTTQLLGNTTLEDQQLHLALGHCTLELKSNSPELIQRLREYFVHILSEPQQSDIEVIAIEAPAPELDVEFIDWIREAGKTGRKDSVHDFPGGRIVRKVRTGMVFLQSEHYRIAAGPCLKNDNQVVNFINAQYLNWLQQRDWLTCHASGLVVDGKALAMAGFSGGGKSTLMLHTLENPEIKFLTNDRLMVKVIDGTLQAAGIPKQPRINPGTIVNNPRLFPLIEAERRDALLAMPKGDLWDLEEKYDAMIGTYYGMDRISTHATLAAFLVLNWHWDSNTPLEMKQIDIADRRDLLQAIMKSPGPFHQYLDGTFFQAQTPFNEDAYINAFKDIPVYEACGKVDFNSLAEQYISAVR